MDRVQSKLKDRGLSYVTGSALSVALMSRGVSFRQRDVTAAVKAVEAAGREVRFIEIERDGRIRIVVVTSSEPVEERHADLEEFEARHGQD